MVLGFLMRLRYDHALMQAFRGCKGDKRAVIHPISSVGRKSPEVPVSSHPRRIPAGTSGSTTHGTMAFINGWKQIGKAFGDISSQCSIVRRALVVGY